MSGRQRNVLALGLLASCGPSERECGCKDVRSDPSVCAEETLCSFTKATEHPGDGSDPVTTYSGDAACVLSVLHDRTPGWISLTSRHFGDGTESPGRSVEMVEIGGDGSFRAYASAIDDAEDSARIDTGQLREPAFFEECMASDDASGCIFNYADESTVHSAACS